MRPTVLVRGTGSIGRRHLQIVRDHLQQAALAWPIRPERCTELRNEGWQAIASLQDAMVLTPLAAIVATDTGRHLDDAHELLAARLPLLIEKPLAATAAGIASLSQAAAQVQGHVYVACPLRFASGLQQVRRSLPLLGRLHGVRIECQSHLPDWRPGRDHRESYAARPDEGGVLRDLIHEIDYAVWLFGRPERVYCRLQDGSRLGIASEAGADLLWQAPGDVAVSLRLDYLTRTARRGLHVYGEHGEIHWDAIAQTVTLHLAGSEAIVTACPQERDAMMAEQARAFLSAVGGGDAGVLSTLDEGAFAVSVCDAARRSAQTGREETISPWQP